MENLKRIEIIANHSVESDIMEALQKEKLLAAYTKIPSAHGRGHTEPKQGDHIWPEENFILIIYGPESLVQAIEKTVDRVREEFPDEGIACFAAG